MTTDINVALQNQLTERQRRKDLRTGVERVFSRRQIEQAFIETFELVGGIPRLAVWANHPDNYGDFLKLLMRMAPKELTAGAMGQVIEYRSMVPQSPLNRAKEEAPAPEQIEEGEFVDVDEPE
jgi:hypothetical protein